MKGSDGTKKYWKIIGWFGISVIALLVFTYFFLLSLSRDKVVKMGDINEKAYPRIQNGFYVSSTPANYPLLTLKKAAYQEGYTHYQQFGKKKGPSYPTDLFEDMTEPADKKEQKKIYDTMYEKGWRDAKNGKNANVVSNRGN